MRIWIAIIIAGTWVSVNAVDFKNDIQPLLKNKCSRCHSGHEAKGEFSINTRTTLLKATKPGNSSASLLYQLITSKDPDERMPSKGAALTPEQIALIKTWIDEGIIWPEAIAPAMVHIVAINYGRSDAVRAAAHDLYDRCLEADIDALLDARDERPGVKFADADLLGLPHRVIVGERNLAEGLLEYSYRRTQLELVTPTQVFERLPR
jgi:hypothetical protein